MLDIDDILEKDVDDFRDMPLNELSAVYNRLRTARESLSTFIGTVKKVHIDRTQQAAAIKKLSRLSPGELESLGYDHKSIKEQVEALAE